MGGAASIETTDFEDVDYNKLKASGLDFSVAYNAIHNKIVKGKSSNTVNDVSINFLAIRQLSQNLKNQERLEKTKKKVLKSRSLPNNLKYKQKQTNNDDEYILHQTYNDLSATDDLDAVDLAVVVDHEFGLSATNVSSNTVTPVAPSVIKKVIKKPNLFLSVESDESPTNTNLSVENGSSHPGVTHLDASKALSPSNHTRLSPHGTLHMGNYQIKENGIFLSNSVNDTTETFSFDSQVNTTGSELKKNPPALGGKNDFIVVATLGSGASGVVSEAIHLPTLTLVALKMLPVYNQQKRQHVSRELAVLYRNLAELRLVDDRLTSEVNLFDALKNEQDYANYGRSNHCANVLSLYNAFIDPKSGMINLVIEYMDGGSLEDLVKQGGCKDERVLADIAYQTCMGLSFLHAHKSVHRDIKPANILCSSNGVIKIADFGISKALDKTSGFANSFVGTVCYMSPERIVGDTYSFPCDIWSLGLTLLAVAKGKFPLSGKEDDYSLNGGGGGGDCLDASDFSDATGDKNAPIGGAGGYWAMIKAICDEEPPSPGREFSTQFNEFIGSCLSKCASDRLSAKSLLQLPFIITNADLAVEPLSGTLQHTTVDTHVVADQLTRPLPKHADANVALRRTIGGTTVDEVPSSPMSARSATAAVVRKVSRDFSPSALGGDFHSRGGGVDCKASDLLEEDEVTFPYSVRDIILEEPHTPTRISVTADDLMQQSDDTIVNAIRLEHLDRVLDKIANKLQPKPISLESNEENSPISSNPFRDADYDEDDEGDGYLLLGRFDEKASFDQVANSSLDSIDKLLFKESISSFPDTKKVAFSSCFAKDENVDDSESDFHKNNGSIAGGSHSILKLSSSYRNDQHSSNVNGSQQRHIHLRDTHKDMDYLNYADEKVLSSDLDKSRSISDNYSNSTGNRSVHFSEAEKVVQHSSINHNVKNLRSRMQMKALELEVSDDVYNADEDDVLHALPKTSSYFMSAGTATSKQDKHEDSKSSSTSLSIDYKSMLPKLNKKGLAKWRNLATQLHLPLHLVRIAVKAKLGGLVELWDEEENS